MAEPKQETIMNKHKDNEPQTYLSDKSSNTYNSDDETDYRSLIAGSAQNNSTNKCLKFWNIIGIFCQI